MRQKQLDDGWYLEFVVGIGGVLTARRTRMILLIIFHGLIVVFKEIF